ncbi:CDP-diacylglycerol--serine O-phosphatidyltransferase [Tilletiaria anomala UBC 951]|uniref:CDP-diacylglycerol--serine O-phosphatidyltransferase n=1 Tax=Tilletiaria anomala (strain ATCC 24038 / CBS 436.72 / UBC 951) TaxID=1037660 RepID=A0A066VRE7_TILAU|nr:CDP-diacylglycerol--serine O-phosphatidyltransferase [Tilletiaria anomala UBC 951]KDN41334.1 CDP-diacylglycerol--serine O-phosphatidyltransferase [Tilletiaria anomala UBC 951]
MPGTIPTITDPAIVISATTSQAPAPLFAASGIHESQQQRTHESSATGIGATPTQTALPLSTAPAEQKSISKAALSASSLEAEAPAAGVGAASLPPSHPAAGVSSLVAQPSANSAFAPSNQPARVTSEMSQVKTGSVAAAPKKPLADKGKKAKGVGVKKEPDLVQFVERDGHFSLVRNFHLADAFTLMNGFCGAQSLFHSARYLLTSDPRHAWFALWFPLFGAIFDMLDGKVARWRRSSSMLGQELDSLADSLSFGAAPAFAAFTLGLRLPFDTLLLTVFVCAGIARLARFNVTTAAVPHDASGKAKYFEGLPIPSSLVLVGGMAVCLLLGRVEAGALSVPSSPATPSVFNPPDGAYRFYGLLARYLPAPASASSAVPLGTFRLDATAHAARALGATLGSGGLGVLTPQSVVTWSSCAALEGHWLSLLWLVWAMAMVSKTLRVPKP